MYADKASIQPLSDGHSRMWMRKEAAGNETEMILYEFSCTGQYRILDGTRFEPYAEQPKGYSVTIGSKRNIPEAEKNWQYIKPDTAFTDAEKVACKK